MELINYSPEDLTKGQILALSDLLDRTWPERVKELTEEQKIEKFYARHPKKTCHCVFEGNELIAYAESFPLTIKMVNKEVGVMGLGGVCVDHMHRGMGLGALLVKDAFLRIQNEEFPLCLFQTGVPEFYEKLDCKVIENKVINSKNESDPNANPFWDDYAMIYPSTFLWPSGTIDILGPGF